MQVEAALAGGASAPGGAQFGGRVRKVSVSMPEELTAAVQRRVGRGGFSRYVAEAVATQLRLDLLAELSGLLDEEHGPVPEELLAEAGAAWPDAG
jgi:Arc/MetJ-type ribon-helix-helix transcriptional regulator